MRANRNIVRKRIQYNNRDGNSKRRDDARMILNEEMKLRKRLPIVEIQGKSDILIMVKTLIGEGVTTLITVYAL